MACHKECSAAEWAETNMKVDGKTGKEIPGTGIAKLKPGTGCFYTRKGSGFCLDPMINAAQPSDLAIPEIAAKRKELREAAIVAGDIKPGDKDW